MAIWRLEKKPGKAPFSCISKTFLRRQCIKTEEFSRREMARTGNKKAAYLKAAF